MIELDLSSWPTAMPSNVCACSLERLWALSVSWLKYLMEKNSNHVLESGFELYTSSNGVVILRPSQPGTWLSIIAAWCNAKYQHSQPTCFSVINSCAIWMMVLQVCSTNSFKDWRPAGAEIMFEPFESIRQRAFPPINFLSESQWNLWGRRPASALNKSSADVIYVDDKYDIRYNQQYLVATSNSNKAQWCPLKATQLPKTMSIWTLSRNYLSFLIGFIFAGFAIVAKETVVDGRRP